ncbi:SAM-dependent methyltransferase [Actinomycetospora lutea]|uniref:SAM-dependent methyltransferase n=1 Tax=Actinomycetospora lutea TaxID=663604 RepID=UPI0023673A57|nr:SAM-dependent methyltransferase [Actinomycetospora lutea]MDD7942810.1 SAM-dependent methyltransferase [Actinomycetospora lutea]
MTEGFASDAPSPARMYDHYLGGRDDFAADREAAEALVAVLHFSPGDEPRRILDHFARRMVPGSYLVLSAGSSEGLTDAELTEIHEAYARTPRGGHLRSRGEITALFAGFELAEPGVVDVSRWRGFKRPTHLSILAGVARRTGGDAGREPPT